MLFLLFDLPFKLKGVSKIEIPIKFQHLNHPKIYFPSKE